MKKITLALSLAFTVFELLAPANAHAFGKPKETTAKPAIIKPAVTKPVVAKPAAVVPALIKPVAITPVATKPAAVQVVAKPIVKKPAIIKAAIKPAKPKITAVRKDMPTQAAKPNEPPAAVSLQPSTGQQVGQAVDKGINTVGGLFDKFKTSVKNPVTQNSCSPAQKSMSQC